MNEVTLHEVLQEPHIGSIKPHLLAWKHMVGVDLSCGLAETLYFAIGFVRAFNGQEWLRL
jgi:hypothetical protein